MTIDETKKFIEFVARKQQSGSNPTPSVFNILIQRAFVQWVMKRYGNTAEYQVGNPIPRVAWQSSQKITDDLRFLLERREFNIPLNTGKLIIPDGVAVTDVNTAICPKYLHASSFRTNYITQIGGVLESNEVPVTEMNDNDIGSILSSSIVKPTHRFPRLAFYNDYIQFYPKNIGRVIFTYLRQPKLPVWGYTVVNNSAVYNPATSVDIESPDETQNEICMMALSYLGISIRDGELTQYAQQLKAEGS